MKDNIQILSPKTEPVLSWIPAHCGLAEKERADELAKAGEKLVRLDFVPHNFMEGKAVR